MVPRRTGQVISVGGTTVGGVPAALKKPAKQTDPGRIRGRIMLFAPETNALVYGRYQEPPQVTGERAADAWETVARTQLRPLTSWTGHKPLTIQPKILLDGYRTNSSVEEQIEQLRGMQDRLSGEEAPRRPPHLKLIGHVPGHYEKTRWVLNGLEVEEQLHRRGDGHCLRALCTLTLLEYVASDVKLRVTATRKKSRVERWLKNDTLKRFCKRELGSSGEQARSQLRKANPKIKSWSKVKTGTRLKVPATRVAAK